jgi:hypothetical protein
MVAAPRAIRISFAALSFTCVLRELVETAAELAFTAAFGHSVLAAARLSFAAALAAEFVFTAALAAVKFVLSPSAGRPVFTAVGFSSAVGSAAGMRRASAMAHSLIGN